MKLLRCHVDAFGKISNADFSFEPGLNIILQGNGWGKSTLAAFLRVMLYGFEGEGKKNNLENERRKYRPWGMPMYGGNLSFSVGDKEYTVYRSFGSKAKEDSFRLVDMATNLESRDYSEYLGEEIFQIDQASFKRTAFMEQQDLVTFGTDSIYAKLSNLCEDTDDINNYETVKEFLNKSLNNLSPNRATGSINALNKEIADMKVKLAVTDQVEGAMDELSRRIMDKRNSGKAFSSELKNLKDMEADLIKLEGRRAILRKRKDLQEEKEHREEGLRLAKATVPDAIPSAEMIEEAKKDLRHLNNMELQLAENRVSDEDLKRINELDAVFSNGFPEDSEIAEANNTLTEMNTIQKKLDVLESEYSELQDNYAKEMHAMGLRLKRIHLRRVYGAVIFLLYVVAEAALFLNRSRIPTKLFPYLIGGVFILGALSLLIFFIIIEVSYKKASVMPNSESRDRKEAEVLDAGGMVENRRKILNAFFNKYGQSCEAATYSMVLINIARDKAEYLRLSDKVSFSEKSGLVTEKNAAIERLNSFLNSTGIYLTGDFANDLQHLTIACNDIRNAEKEYMNAVEKLEAFEKENSGYEDFAETKDQDFPYSLSEIREKIEGIESNLAENDRLLKQEERRREDLAEELAELSAMAYELAEKQEKLAGLKEKYKTYENTLAFLEKAHEELNATLLSPLSDRFREHLEEMGYAVSGQDTGKVYVDSHAQVTIEEAGDRRELKFFSSGIKDLVNVAMRVALLDNMYDSEKPFVILDDPFVNLDEGKMTIAKDFLDKLSEDYQIVYFTCRNRFV